MATPAFDVDAFLAEPLQAMVATNGPTVRPLWYQWEEGCFWMISGPWAKLFHRMQKDPEVSVLVDVCDIPKGRILQVIASGAVEIVPYDVPRARRMLYRYLGPDEASWSSKPDDYRGYLRGDGPPGAVWLKLKPRKFLPFNFCFQE